MVERIINLDYILFQLGNTPWPGGDEIMWAVSGNFWWIPLYALLIWEMWKRAEKKNGPLGFDVGHDRNLRSRNGHHLQPFDQAIHSALSTFPFH